MSRPSQAPSRSPSFSFERQFRSVHSPAPNSNNPNFNKRSLLLSENELNDVKLRKTKDSISFQDSNEDTIGKFSTQIQEYAIIEDLLFILLGIDGTYIKRVYPKTPDEDPETNSSLSGFENWNQISYVIDPTLDPSLKNLVEKFLPLSTYYSSVNAFVEVRARFEYGLVNHALGAAMKAFLKQYKTFIAQLDGQFHTSNTFTLQKIWFYAQDTLHSMNILHSLVTAIRSIQVMTEIAESDEDDIEAVIEGLKEDEETKSSDKIIPEQQKGGAILNILANRLVELSGGIQKTYLWWYFSDPNCKKVYTSLLSKASVPYFEMLRSWIYHGEIVDPYNEFMVLEKTSVKKENLKEDFNDAYWEMRYTIRENAVPVFLEPVKNQILLAGKYLNVVRECGVNIADPKEMEREVTNQREQEEKAGFRNQAVNSTTHVPRSEIWGAVNGEQFASNLEIAYKYANRTLLNLLMNERQLIGRLRSLKHYFFLDQSDFLTSFLYLAKDELKQPASEISQARLQSLMDLVLRNSSSVAAYDPFKEDVKVSMSHLKLVDQLLRIINVAGMEAAVGKDSRPGLMDALERSQSLSSSVMTLSSMSSRDVLSGYDALIIDYTVTFPLSLVISRKALTKYQLLFRHILNMKHVEDLLCGAWIDQKTTLWKAGSDRTEVEQWKFRIFSLRNRMLIFVKQLTYYVTNEVLEPNWRRLESNLMKVSTVDEVLQYHSDFLDSCLKECMLTNSKLLRIFNKLVGSCVAFTVQAEKYSSLLEQMEEERKSTMFGVPREGLGDSIPTAALIENSQRAISKLEETFLYHMRLLVDALNFFSATETTQFPCLVMIASFIKATVLAVIYILIVFCKRRLSKYCTQR
ncbi:Spc98 family-domain-containing protein [Sporodiniella umbellata]|nr:Spc98 family-domain-containing protein [Sporodiniella umbellata]